MKILNKFSKINLFFSKNHTFFKFVHKNFSKDSQINILDYSYDTRDFLSKINEYEEKIDDRIIKTEINDDPLDGWATEQETEKYTKRNTQDIHKENFRTLYQDNIKVSSIGLGTYIGNPDDITDFYMYNAVKSLILSGGVNVIDTAINYRYMKSERSIGKALKALCQKYDYDRREFFISSKIGFVPEDADNGHRSHYYVQKLIEDNKLSMEDILFDEKKRPVHCIHPEYLKEQLDYSLKNLNLKTIDLMYLHNAVESQGAVLDPDNFEDRLSKAFEFLESARKDGKLRYYGMATWNCFRTSSSNKGLYANLQDIVELVEKVCGKENGFKFIQVPINIMHPEAFVESYQNFKHESKGIIPVTLTAACSALNINLISSSPLMQGYIVNLPLENSLFNVKHNSSKHIQLIRSIPAECLKSK